MSGSHDHHSDGAHGHSHAPEVTSRNARAVGLAALLTAAFMVAEVVGGLVSGSLALLADAGHMLTDTGALVLAWLGFRLAQRRANWKLTYGFDRFSVLFAFVNGLALFVIAALICREAWIRFDDPHPIEGGIMLAVAVAGLLVNLFALKLLSGGDRSSLNIRAASLHVMGDLLGSVAAIAAAGIIIWTGWTPIDPILSVFVALIILKGAWSIVRQSAHILLEGAPEGLEADRISADLVDHVEGLAGVHVHAWSIREGRPMVTLHARPREGADPALVIARIRERLAERFHTEHATIELEPAGSGECHDHGCH